MWKQQALLILVCIRFSQIMLLIIYKPFQPQDDHRQFSPRNIVMSFEVSFLLLTWCCFY